MTIWYAQFLVTPFGTQIVETVHRGKVRQLGLNALSSPSNGKPHRRICSDRHLGADRAYDRCVLRRAPTPLDTEPVMAYANDPDFAA